MRMMLIWSGIIILVIWWLILFVLYVLEGDDA